MDVTGDLLDRFNRHIVGLECDYLAVIRGTKTLAQLRTSVHFEALLPLIDRHGDMAVSFARIKSGHAMTPRHGINVMLICRAWMSWGHQLGKRLDDFTFSALIHDLGHWHPDDLVFVFAAYSHDQARLLGAHTRTAPWRDAVLDDEMIHWIENHHEQPDGKGYPSRTTEVPLLAQALRVVDCYDGLTTARRTRPTYSGFEALVVLKRWSGYKFAKGLFQNFARFMGEYPLGTLVKLVGGERAIMVPSDGADPRALVVTNPQGDELEQEQHWLQHAPTIDREIKHWYWCVPDTSPWRFVRPDLLDLPRSYLDDD